MMDADLAVKIMYADASADELAEKAKEYDALQGSVMTAARRGYVDLIVDPADTRKYLVDAFELLYTKCAYTPVSYTHLMHGSGHPHTRLCRHLPRC